MRILALRGSPPAWALLHSARVAKHDGFGRGVRPDHVVLLFRAGDKALSQLVDDIAKV